MLGLKTISVISETLKLIDEHEGVKITLDELYTNKNIRNDENVFDMIKNKETETVFQFESSLFKSLVSEMQPDDINDLTAVTSIARPGPLSAGFNKTYSKRKLGLEETTYDLNCDDILGDTYGCILYQEQLMLIAKKVAGFDDNQADTYLRKSVAKKKKKLMDLCKTWFIYGKPEHDKYGNPITGGINNGYSEQELITFWTDVVEGCASYLFNKSHATSYSLITCVTAWLKYYYPCEYFTAVLTLLDKDDKREPYIEVLEKNGIEVTVPDINKSIAGFTCDVKNKKILFGLQSIKKVGEKPIKHIIENRPYDSIEDFCNKISRSKANKAVVGALIKSGAFDSLYNNEYTNRYTLLNRFYDLREDKTATRVNPDEYDKLKCIKLEKETLSLSLTYDEWISNLKAGDKVKDFFTIKNIRETTDKNGNLMAFITVEKDDVDISLTVFSRDYVNNIDKFIINSKLEIKAVVSEFAGKKNLVWKN